MDFASETQVPLPEDELCVGLVLLVVVDVVDGMLDENFHFSVQSGVEVKDAVVNEVVGEGVVGVGVCLVLQVELPVSDLLVGYDAVGGWIEHDVDEVFYLHLQGVWCPYGKLRNRCSGVADVMGLRESRSVVVVALF